MDNNKEETTLEREREQIQGELNTMSFEDLLKLKEEMGTKLYQEAVSGETALKRVNVNHSFKRANKNRPREMSSKKFVRLGSDNTNVKKVEKSVPRDPRFESVCGTFDKESFKSNYKFINDVRKKEMKQLEDQLKNTTDEEEKTKIKLVLQRLGNQIREEEKGQKQKETKRTQMFEDEEGKRHFKKKSVSKLESLINKYEELKKNNKVHKHIERKSEKIAAKERKIFKKQTLM